MLIDRSVEVYSLTDNFMLNHESTLIGQRNLVNYACDIPLDRQLKSSLRYLHPVDLHKYLFERLVKTVMTKYTQGLQCSNLANILNVKTFKLIFEGERRLFVEY